MHAVAQKGASHIYANVDTGFVLGATAAGIAGIACVAYTPCAVAFGLGMFAESGDPISLISGPARLSGDLAGTFAGGRYASRVLEKDLILYRAGTAGSPLGQFFSKDIPVSVLQTRIDKAVLPVWPGGAQSVLDTVFKVRIPAGTTVHTGKVGSQGGFYVGGTQQIVVQQPWLIDGVKVLDSWPLK